MTIKIAIDGPAGAGKSSAAKLLAKELNYIYIDTGALYRAVGLYMLRNNVGNMKSSDEIKPLLECLKVELKHINNVQRVIINDEDVSDLIRTPEVSMAASDVSSVKCVRDFLLDLQRNIAIRNNVIMDGRDIGTVVLPDAQIKIFLTASAEDRAKRREKELKEKGMEVNYTDILNDIIKRDYNDSHREIAPLKPADDAILIDNSGLDLEQTVLKLKSIIKERVADVL